MRALFPDRRTRQATGLVAMQQALDAFTAEGGVGGDHRVHARFDQGRGDQRGFFIAHVRGDLDCQRHMLAAFGHQLRAALGQGIEQLLERVAELQAAQARGVRRADVDGDVAGLVVDLVEADQVVVHRALDRGVEVLADVDAEDAAVFGCTHTVEQVVDTQVVEAHAVDDRLGFRQAEQARLGVAWLRTRGDGTDLDKTETQLGEAVDGRAVFVQTRRQSDRVGEVQAHDSDRQGGRRLGQQPVEAQAATGADQVQGQVMGSLRGELEQQLAGQGIHGRRELGWRRRVGDYSRVTTTSASSPGCRAWL
ncbi:hypothetical protein D3C80_945190 [compost metagenome]